MRQHTGELATSVHIYCLFVSQTLRISQAVWTRQAPTQVRVLSLELGVRQEGQTANRCSDNYSLALGVGKLQGVINPCSV